MGNYKTRRGTNGMSKLSFLVAAAFLLVALWQARKA
jgi:hypothetical protein